MSEHITFVLDSFALLAYWRDEAGAAQVAEYLPRAESEQVTLALSAINVGEIVYLMTRRWGETTTRSALAFITEGPFQICEATFPRVLSAAHIKARYPISYADAFAAALTMELNATLLTGDPEFRALEGRISIEWLGDE